MKLSTFLSTLSLAYTALGVTFDSYTDSNDITFWQGTWDTAIKGAKGNAQFGLALPPAAETGLTDEYIGRLVVPKTTDGTWLGLSHTSGMTTNLLLVTWLDGDKVKTSFRYASDYVAPNIYIGNATLSTISQSSNATHYEITYRCEGCWMWSQDGVDGSQIPATTASAAQIVGWAQATVAPANPGNADSGIRQHAAEGAFAATVASARNSGYTKWTSLATAAPTGVPSGTPPSNGTASPTGSATATSSSAP